MKEKILQRLTKTEIQASDPTARNEKLKDALEDNLDLDIQQVRLVDDSDKWRGWVVSYNESDPN